jgi:pyrroloquinoline quinone biosynthesis protein D
VRLHFDTRRQAWMLLAPERVVETEDPAHDILSRCDGSRTVQQIVDELTEIYTADRAEIADDVAGLLAELVGKRMVEL